MQNKFLLPAVLVSTALVTSNASAAFAPNVSAELFALSIDGENVAGIENLTYHIAYRFLAEQDKNQSATADDEMGLATGLNYKIDVNDKIGLDILLEYAGIDNMRGVKNTTLLA